MSMKPALVDQLTDRVMGAPEPPPEPDEAELPPEPYDYQEDFWLARPYYSDEYAGDVIARFEKHLDAWSNSGLGAVVWNAYRSYHNLSGIDGDPLSQIQATGEAGELLALNIPHYRSLVRHQIALFTAERPAWDPQARSSDADAARQVPLASNLLDYVAAVGSLDQRLAEQVEMMMIAGAGYFVVGWDENVGLNGRGWFTQRIYAPWELVHEEVRSYDDTTWWIWRSYESRWDWVARFAKDDPEKAEKIAKLEVDKSDFSSAFRHHQREATDSDGDRIAVLTVVAKPTIACPQGRYSLIASDDVVLYDGPYPYGEDVTISRMCASEFLGSAIPYCDSWGMLAPSEAFNAILSMILTRVDTCGIPNFCVPEGSEVEFADIASGNSLWKVPPGSEKPVAVDLLQVPDVLPGLLQMLGSEMEKVVGINSVTRGQPQENVSSGSMAALLQSMAIQFNSNLERAWVLNLERIGTHHLRVFQRMASEEHAVSVVGADRKWTVKTFKGEDLSNVLRVTVKTASALSKTTAGRAEIADKLLERQMVTPQEYLQIISTGQLEPTFAGPVGELTCIKSRSEKLMRMEPAPPLAWDNHQLCIREFKELLNTEAREDMQLAKHISDTIKAQFDLWAQLSREAPDMLMAIGCPPLPQALQIGQQAMAMQQGAMGGAGGPPMPNLPQPKPQEQPNTEDGPRPGPDAMPGGAEPTGAHPKMPKEPEPAREPLHNQPVV